MKKTIHVILRNLFVFVFVAATVDGINVRGGAFGYVLLGLVFAVAMMLVPTIIRFFKLPVNFAAVVLVGTLMSILIFFSFRYLVLGCVDFGSTVVGGDVEGFFNLPILRLDALGTVIYGAVLASLLSAIMHETSKKE